MVEMGIGQSALEAALAGERARLVRLCAQLTGDTQAAEDLAQETLVEAWRCLAKLRTPDGLAPWLTAIARNVCLRWGRARGRDLRAPRAMAPDLESRGPPARRGPRGAARRGGGAGRRAGAP